MKAVFLVCLVLGGCAYSSGVQKMGPDTYSISVEASPARGGEPGARAMALSDANKHCAGVGREVLVTNVSSGRMGFGFNGGANITFQCLAKGDPALQRPEYQSAPTAVIQTR